MIQISHLPNHVYFLCIFTQKKEPSKSIVKKKVTKVAEAKKVMKRNFKANKKITFTDEGEVRWLNASCLMYIPSIIKSVILLLTYHSLMRKKDDSLKHARQFLSLLL